MSIAKNRVSSASQAPPPLGGQLMRDERHHAGPEDPSDPAAKGRGRGKITLPTVSATTWMPSADRFQRNAPLAAFAAAVLGCLTTLGLCTIGITAPIASALATALICGLVLVTDTAGRFAHAFSPALYGGTFSGMTPIAWIDNGALRHSVIMTGMLSLSLSLCCGLVFFVVTRGDARAANPTTSGYGGRLGAIAAVASFLFVALAGQFGADVSHFQGVRSGTLDVASWVTPSRFLACLSGTFITMVALRRAAGAGSVSKTFVASLVALFGLLTAHVLTPADASVSEAFYAGCFLGMSTQERLTGWFRPIVGVLVLTAVLIPVRGLLPGVGGGLGLSAFATVALLAARNPATASRPSRTQILSGIMP